MHSKLSRMTLTVTSGGNDPGICAMPREDASTGEHASPGGSTCSSSQLPYRVINTFWKPYCACVPTAHHLAGVLTQLTSLRMVFKTWKVPQTPQVSSYTYCQDVAYALVQLSTAQKVVGAVFRWSQRLTHACCRIGGTRLRSNCGSEWM